MSHSHNKLGNDDEPSIFAVFPQKSQTRPHSTASVSKPKPLAHCSTPLSVHQVWCHFGHQPCDHCERDAWLNVAGTRGQDFGDGSWMNYGWEGESSRNRWMMTRSILHGYFNPLVFWYQLSVLPAIPPIRLGIVEFCSDVAVRTVVSMGLSTNQQNT